MRQAQQIFDYASNQYATQPEYLWEKYPEYAILRHGNAKGKWYALIGKISKTKLGLKEGGETDFINLKCPPDMVSILRQSPFLARLPHEQNPLANDCVRSWRRNERNFQVIGLELRLNKVEEFKNT